MAELDHCPNCGTHLDQVTDELERMQNLLRTPVAWHYQIDRYCDHAACDGVVLRKDELSDAIPANKITWTALYVENIDEVTNGKSRF